MKASLPCVPHGATQLGEFDYFLNTVIDEGDIDWIAKTVMVMRNKSSAKEQVKDYKLIGLKLFALQNNLAVEEKYVDAERITTLFDGMPISPPLHLLWRWQTPTRRRSLSISEQMERLSLQQKVPFSDPPGIEVFINQKMEANPGNAFYLLMS